MTSILLIFLLLIVFFEILFLFFFTKRYKTIAKKTKISPTYVPFLKEQEFNPYISTDDWDLHKLRLDKYRRYYIRD